MFDTETEWKQIETIKEEECHKIAIIFRFIEK